MSSYDSKMDMALEAKRSGDYEKAIRIYNELADNTQDFTQLQEIYYSTGKVYYLCDDYSNSLQSYYKTLFFNALQTPSMLNDYICIFYDKALPGVDEMSMMRFKMFIQNYCRHIGHAIVDAVLIDKEPAVIYQYVLSVAGRENRRTQAFKQRHNVSDNSAPNQAWMDQYEDMCFNKGTDCINEMMKQIIEKVNPTLLRYMS